MKGQKKAGGSAKAYDAKDSNVVAEADDKKEGSGPKRKRGGKVEGKAPMKRLDRPCRKSGGRVGADKSPLSSAASTSPVQGHSTDS